MKIVAGDGPTQKMKLNAASIALLFVAATPIFAQLPGDQQQQFDEAERRIVRLPPSAFPQLPHNVVTELERRGCTIPQEAFTRKPHNVVKGNFAKPGQVDWAVHCDENHVAGLANWALFTLRLFRRSIPINGCGSRRAEQRPA